VTLTDPLAGPVIPSHWSWKKLKHVATLRSGESITSDDIGETGKYPVFGGNGLRGFTSRFTHRGEFPLIGRQGALCGNINYASGEFWASEHAVVVSVREGHVVRWLGELLRSMDLNQYSQSAAQPGIAVEVVANLPIPVPPPGEQRLIAEFISHETARIDVLLAEKERMLTLLDEKRAAMISQVVTGGLDPKVRMKPSGEEWLGNIPQHWRLIRAKALFREIDVRSATGEETLLSLRLGKGLVPHHDVSDKPLEASDVVGFKKVEIGQMVINRMRAASGLIAVAEQAGLVSPDYAVFDILGCELCVEYFLELFKTPLLQAVFRASSKGLGTGEQGFLRLYTDAFLALHFPYPPENEQRTIAAFIQLERTEFETTEVLLRRSIELAKERRAALISAAVTGQIRVGEMLE
jgi:type I restriction enzyme, S subunit